MIADRVGNFLPTSDHGKFLIPFQARFPCRQLLAPLQRFVQEILQLHQQAIVRLAGFLGLLHRPQHAAQRKLIGVHGSVD